MHNFKLVLLFILTFSCRLTVFAQDHSNDSSLRISLIAGSYMGGDTGFAESISLGKYHYDSIQQLVICLNDNDTITKYSKYYKRPVDDNWFFHLKYGLKYKYMYIYRNKGKIVRTWIWTSNWVGDSKRKRLKLTRVQ